jgi:hypothetical protein
MGKGLLMTVAQLFMRRPARCHPPLVDHDQAVWRAASSPQRGPVFHIMFLPPPSSWLYLQRCQVELKLKPALGRHAQEARAQLPASSA